MDHLSNAAEIVFIGLCCRLGTPTQVTIRREIMDILEIIPSPMKKGNSHFIHMISGSYRDGFRFESSDLDMMLWYTNNKVICEMSQFMGFYASDENIILMEYLENPPGFVKLKLLTPTRNLEYLHFSVVMHGKDRYLSSEIFRNKRFQFLLTLPKVSTWNLQSHGPVANFNIKGIDIDYGMCLHSLNWPQTAYPWIDRCIKKQWPVKSVLKTILSNGCHVMPIESKTDSDEKGLEWRISFSLAEQKIVNSMNHVQFICYGVLKILYKEVFRVKKKESLLCSYYLKTILLWEIQNNPSNTFWHPSNFVMCFWMCFKRLCKCVLDSNCPNFFIPENNMFRNKIVGAASESLFSELYGYYEMKEKFLLLSPTLSSILKPIIDKRRIEIPFSRELELSVFDMDRCIIGDLFGKDPSPHLWKRWFFPFKRIECLSQLPLSQFQLLAIQYCLANALVKAAFVINNQFTKNKIWYRFDRKILHLLKLASRIGPVSQVLYLGVHYYSTGRLNKVLKITDLCLHMFSQPFLLFQDRADTNEKQYTEIIGKYSLSKRMTKAWIDSLSFIGPIACLSKSESGFHISPYVLVHMLNVLTNIKLTDTSRCIQSLTKLHELLCKHEGYKCGDPRIISCYDFEICQQIVSDLREVVESYQESTLRTPHHGIQKAVETSMERVLQQLSNKC